MDIEIELEQMLQQYGLQIELDSIIKGEICEYISERCEGKKVAIMCAGKYTEHLLEDFSQVLRPKCIFDNNVQKVGESIRGIPVCSVEKYNEFDIIVIGTYDYRSEVREQLMAMGVALEKIVDIYDFVQENGVLTPLDYYTLGENVYVPFIILNNLWKKAIGKKKEEYLLKLIKAYLCIRDIVSAKFCLDLYRKTYSFDRRMTDFSEKLDRLLDKVKKVLALREHKDIIWSWEDALHYEWVEYMPFHKSAQEKGLFFKNAFASSVTTRMIYDQIFNKHYEIDDKSYLEAWGKQKSSLINQLQLLGYQCVRVDNQGNTQFQDLGEFNFVKEKVVGFQVATSKQYWLALNYMIQSSKPVFILIHSAIEVHQPACSPWLYKYNSQWSNFQQRCEKDIQKVLMDNVKINCRYLDEQAAFVDDLLGVNAVRIFMSDHGTPMDKRSRRWNEDYTHFVFSVWGADIEKRECDRLFCLYNFSEVIQFILQPTDEKFNRIFMEDIVLQGLDYYNKDMIIWHMNHGRAQDEISFRGLMTLHDRYILTRTGEEIYNVFPDDYTNYIEDERFQERIGELRRKVGNYFIDYQAEEKFKYTHLLYEFLEEQKK